MIEVFSRYIETFLHPFHIQRELGDKANAPRLSEAPLLEERSVGVKFWEAISISWIWYLLHVSFVLFALYVSSLVYEQMEGHDILTEILLETWQSATARAAVIGVLVSALIFPISEFLFYKIMTKLIRFFADLFQNDASDEQIDQVVSCALCANAFYVIPFFGRMLSYFALEFYLFAGLKNNLRMSNLQSFIVVISPILLIFFSMSVFFTFIILMLGFIF